MPVSPAGSYTMKVITASRNLASLLLVSLAGLLLATCSLRPAAEAPALVLIPAAGGPGSTIQVEGSHFPAGTELQVRLGPPAVGATPRAYATAVADGQGAFTLPLILPAVWPDGSSITEAELLVVALNEDGTIQATAPLAYRPAAGGR